jgi:hypothetical protein
MNRLHVGFSKDIELPKGGFLYIDDEVREVPHFRVFDPLRHSFNPLKNINYRGAAAFVEIIDALFSRGDSTLTKDTGLDFIFDALEKGPRFLDALIDEPEKKDPTGHMWAYGKVERILRSPVLRRVFLEDADRSQTNFSFRTGSKIFARVNRAELGDFDALVLGLLSIGFQI